MNPEEFIINNLTNKVREEIRKTPLSYPIRLDFKIDFSVNMGIKENTSMNSFEQEYRMIQKFNNISIKQIRKDVVAQVEPTITTAVETVPEIKKNYTSELETVVVPEIKKISTAEAKTNNVSRLEKFIGCYVELFSNGERIFHPIYIQGIAPSGHIFFISNRQGKITSKILKKNHNDDNWTFVADENVEMQYFVPEEMKKYNDTPTDLCGIPYWEQYNVREMECCTVIADFPLKPEEEKLTYNETVIRISEIDYNNYNMVKIEGINGPVLWRLRELEKIKMILVPKRFKN